MTWRSAKWMMTFLCFVLSPLLLSKCATLNVIYLDLHFGENKRTQNHKSTAWIIPWNICPGYLHIYTVIHFWHFPMSFKDNIIKDYWDIFQQWRLHRLCSHFSWWDHSVLSLNSDAHCNPPVMKRHVLRKLRRGRQMCLMLDAFRSGRSSSSAPASILPDSCPTWACWATRCPAARLW